MNEGYFVKDAAETAEHVTCPVIVVGGFRALDTIENVLNLTKIEAVSLSRPLLREPDLPLKWQQDPSVISKCISCNRCYQSEAHKCVFRERDQQRGRPEGGASLPPFSRESELHDVGSHGAGEEDDQGSG